MIAHQYYDNYTFHRFIDGLTPINETTYKYKNKHEDDFWLIVQGSNGDEVTPYKNAKIYFPSSKLDDRNKWAGTIINHRLKLTNSDVEYNIKDFSNKYESLN